MYEQYCDNVHATLQISTVFALFNVHFNVPNQTIFLY